MTIKPGVRILGVKPETVIGMLLASSVYEQYRAQFCVTSVSEGSHMRSFLHYAGCAFDCQLPFSTIEPKGAFMTTLCSALGPDFDVILEENHIHIEYQPKKSI